MDDISLNLLVEIEPLSLQSTNVCRIAELTSLNKILDFYYKNGVFIKLKMCGVKANKELTDFCKKMIVSQREFRDQRELLNDFTDLQRDVFYRYFHFMVLQLDAGTRKRLSKISPSFDLVKMYYVVFTLGSESQPLFGTTNNEAIGIDQLKKHLTWFAYLIKNTSENDLIKEFVKLMLRKLYPNLPENFEDFFDTAFCRNGKIRLFKLLEYLLLTKQFLNQSELEVFMDYYRLNTAQEGEAISVSKFKTIRSEENNMLSRVRYHLPSYILFVTYLSNDFVEVYPDLSFTKPASQSTETLMTRLNSHEKVRFNLHFYKRVFQLINTCTDTVGYRQLNPATVLI